jgi:toxin ParE1/3/4
MPAIRLTGPAASDIAALLEWSEETFGTTARRRYEALIATALKDIAQDWQRAGSVRRDDLRTGCRAYHLRHSRNRARVRGGVVQSPRHILAYRLVPGDIVVVLRVLHGSMDLSRHLDAPPE